MISANFTSKKNPLALFNTKFEINPPLACGSEGLRN
jgi:hypothetical protein